MAITKDQLTELTLETMDAVSNQRWSTSMVNRVLNSVYADEWSNILNAQPYYRFAQRAVTTDANGQVPFTSLDSGSGESKQNFYRILSVSNGNVLYTQTRFQDVPLATTTNYLPSYPRLYYTVGTSVQILPVSGGTSILIAVNYKPANFMDLAGTTAIDFPDANETIIANEAGARLLNKGGAESVAAKTLRDEANLQRSSMLDDLRRYTINPTMMAYPDQKYDWSGG